MKNILRSSVELSFHILSSYISEDTIAVDATCGNGHDTLALLKAGVKKVFAFDIQKEAIDSTTKLLEKNYDNFKNKVEFINDSHENLQDYVRCADVIVFNLGYLPSGDKSITTTTSSTLKALTSALEILSKDGICSVVMYDGHPSGKAEKKELLAYAKQLDGSKYHTAYINLLNQHNHPPEILLITKKKEDNYENKKR